MELPLGPLSYVNSNHCYSFLRSLYISEKKPGIIFSKIHLWHGSGLVYKQQKFMLYKQGKGRRKPSLFRINCTQSVRVCNQVDYICQIWGLSQQACLVFPSSYILQLRDFCFGLHFPSLQFLYLCRTWGKKNGSIWGKNVISTSFIFKLIVTNNTYCKYNRQKYSKR